MFLIENECKTHCGGDLTFIFNQKYFFNNMNLNFFYFHVTIYSCRCSEKEEGVARREESS